MPRADWKQMQQYIVPLPPEGLLSAFNSVIEPIIQQIKSLSFANRSLSTARDLLLPRLMNGNCELSASWSHFVSGIKEPVDCRHKGATLNPDQGLELSLND